MSIYSGGGLVAIGPVNASGVWTTTVLGVGDGTYVFSGTITDPAGNEGPSDSVTFIVDTVAPLAPVIAAPTSGEYLTTGTVSLQGTGEAGGVISIYSGGVVIATGVVSASGTWTLTLT